MTTVQRLSKLLFKCLQLVNQAEAESMGVQTTVRRRRRRGKRDTKVDKRRGAKTPLKRTSEEV